MKEQKNSTKKSKFGFIKRYFKKHKSAKFSIVVVAAACFFLLMLLPFQSVDNFSLDDFGKPELWGTEQNGQDSTLKDSATDDKKAESENTKKDSVDGSTGEDNTKSSSDTKKDIKDNPGLQNTETDSVQPSGSDQSLTSENEQKEDDGSGFTEVLKTGDNDIQSNSSNPGEFDFSEYNNPVYLDQDRSGTTVQSTQYPASDKFANLTFYGPHYTSFNSKKFDASTVSSNGYYIHGNRFSGIESSGSNCKCNLVGNYIKIVPTTDLYEVTVKITIYDYYSTSKLPYLCIADLSKAGTNPVKLNSTTRVAEVQLSSTINSPQTKTITCNLSAGKEYCLCLRTYDYYGDYSTSGDEYIESTISNITMSAYSGTLSGKFPATEYEHDYNLTYTSSDGRTQSQELTSGSASKDFNFDNIIVNTTGQLKISLKDHPEINRTIDVTEKMIRSGVTIPESDIKNAVESMFYTLDVVMNRADSSESPNVNLSIFDRDETVELDEDSKTISIKECFKGYEGLVTLSAVNESDEIATQYAYVKVDTDSKLTVQFNNIGKSKTVKAVITNFEDEPEYSPALKIKINQVSSSGTVDRDFTLPNQKTHYFVIGTKIFKSEYDRGLQYDDGSSKQRITFPQAINADLECEVIMPTYVWSKPEGGTWTCTGKYTLDTGKEVTELCSEANGKVTSHITEFPTSSKDGNREYNAQFKEITTIFSTSKHDEVIGKLESHSCEGINYEPWSKTTELPTSGNYVLTCDVDTSNNTTTISSNTTLNLCLYGHAIKGARISNYGTLNITDCQHDDKDYPHYFNVDSSGFWTYTKTKTDNVVYGGVITGATKCAINNYGQLKCNSIHLAGNAQTENTASTTGGAITTGSTSSTTKLEIDNCIFTGNKSCNCGGAIALGRNSSSEKTTEAKISNSNFYYNFSKGSKNSPGNIGGGGAISVVVETPSIDASISGCEFKYNWTDFKGGAVYIPCGTVHISDSVFTDNTSGVGHTSGDGASPYYGGAIAYWANKSYSYKPTVYLGGYLYIQGNSNASKGYEDNFSMRQKGDSQSGDSCIIQIDPNNRIKEGSLIGVNYSYMADGRVSNGYYNTYNNDAGWPFLKYFVLDDVQSKTEYAVLLKTKTDDNTKPAYEVYIVKHVHSFVTNITQQLNTEDYDNPAFDTASLICDTGDIIEGESTYSKCKYGYDDLNATIKSQDGGIEILDDDPIPYDGNPHPAMIENQHEFEAQAFAKWNKDSSGEFIHYEQRSIDPATGTETWTPISGVPTTRGTYRAYAEFYPVTSLAANKSTGEKVTYSTTTKRIVSNAYSIGYIPLTLEANGVERDFDGTNKVTIKDDYHFYGINAGDEVYIDTTTFVGLTDDEFVGVNKPITNFDSSKVKLTGKDADKYYIKKIENSYCTINTATPVIGFNWDQNCICFKQGDVVDLISIIYGAHPKTQFEFWKCPWWDENIWDVIEFSEDGRQLYIKDGVGSWSGNKWGAANGRSKDLDLNNDGVYEYWGVNLDNSDYAWLNAFSSESKTVRMYFKSDTPDANAEFSADYDVDSKCYYIDCPAWDEKTYYYTVDGSSVKIDDHPSYHLSTNTTITKYNSDKYKFTKITKDPDWEDDILRGSTTFTFHFEELPKPSIDASITSELVTTDGEVIPLHDTDDLTNLHLGDKIQYRVTLKNTGNVELSNLTIADDLLGRGATPYTVDGTLGKKDSGTDTKEVVLDDKYVVKEADIMAGSITNYIVASGVYDGTTYKVGDQEGKRVQVTDTTEALIKDISIVDACAIDSSTSAVKEKVKLGDKIKYKFTVKNNGNTTVNDIDIYYSLSQYIKGVTPIEKFSLAPGESKEITTAEYTVDLDQVATEGVNAGYLLNNIKATGQVKKNTTQTDSVASPEVVVKNQIEYNYVDAANMPSPKELTYTGYSQLGITYGASSSALGYSTSKAEGLDAGEYVVTCKLDPFYKWADGTMGDKTIKFIIKKAPLTVTVNKQKDYDGSAYKYPITNTEIQGFVADEGLSTTDESFVVTNSSEKGIYNEEGSGVKNYSQTLIGKKNTNITKNYEINNSVSLEILAANLEDPDIAKRISASAVDKVYNTKPQTTTLTLNDSATGKTMVLGTDYTITAGDTKTDTGSYSITIEGKGNYSGTLELKGTDGNGIWKITPAPITIELTGCTNSSIYYDGKDHGFPSSGNGYTAKLIAGETEDITLAKIKDKINPTSLSTTGKEVGTYDLLNSENLSKFIVAKAGSTTESDTNYNATFVRTDNTGILTIKKRSLEDGTVKIIQDKTDPLIYNTEEQTVKVKITIDGTEYVMSPEEFAKEFNITGNTGTDAYDGYKATITAKNDSNFEGSIDVPWEILKKEITIDATGVSKETDYCAEKVSTDAMETIPFTGKSDKFSTIFTSNGTDVLFDGSGNVISYTGIGSAANQLTATTTPVGSTKTSNYTITYSTSATNPYVKINPRELTVTPTAAIFDYDKTAHSLTKEGVTVDGLVSGKNHVVSVDDIKFGTDNTATEVKDSKNVKVASIIVKNEVGDNLTKNYKPVFEEAALTINKAKIKLAIVGNIGEDSENYTYNATEKTVSGYKVTPINVTSCATSLFTPANLSPTSAQCIVKCTNVEGKKYYQYPNEGGSGTHDLTADDFKYTDDNVEVVENGITYDSVNSGYISIQKAKLSLTVNDSIRRNDEDPQPLTHTLVTSGEKCEISGLCGSDTMSGTITTDGSDVGDYTHPKKTSSVGDLTWNFTFDPSTSENNYEIGWENVILNIRNDIMRITIQGNSNETAKYTGKEQQVEGYTASASQDSTVTFYPEYLKYKDGKEGTLPVAKGTNVGTYYMNLNAADFSYNVPTDPTLKYEIVLISDGKLVIGGNDITREMITITGGTTFEYDGTAKSPDISVKYGDTVLTSKDYYITDNVAVDKGDYTAKVIGRGNFSNKEVSIPWRINAAVVKFDIVGNKQTFPFNGLEQTVKGYTYTVDKLANLINPNYMDPGDQSDAAIAKGKAAGTYYMTLDASAFKYNDPKGNIVASTSSTVDQGSLTITKRSLKNVDVVLVDGEYEFDNQPHKPEVKVYDNGKLVDPSEYDISGDLEKTDAGDYKITIKPSDNSSYEDDSTADWYIVSKYVEINIKGKTLTKTYDGKAATVDGFDFNEITTTGMPLEYSKIKPNQTCSITGTNQGLYYMDIDISKFTYDDTNYRVKFYLENDGCLTINKKDVSSQVSVDVDKTQFVYNGQEQGPRKAEGLSNYVKYILENGDEILLQENVDFIAIDKTATNVGNYTLKIVGVGNYSGQLDIDWSIIKADLDLYISGNTIDDVPYDGTKHSVTGYTITAGTGQETLKDLVAVSPISSNCVASGVDAGTYNMGLFDSGKFSASNTDNVTTNIHVTKEGYIKIVPADLSMCSASASNLVYNGGEQTTKILAKNGNLTIEEGKDFIVESGNTGTDVGPYSATIKAKDNGNYTGTKSGIAWNITKASISADVAGKTLTENYDGTEKTISGYEITSSSKLFDKSKVTGTVSGDSISGTNAGEYKSTLDISGLGYSDTNVDCVFNVAQNNILTINRAALNITVNEKEKYSEGNKFSHTIDTTSEVEGLIAGHTFNGTVTTNSDAAGVYTADADYEHSYTSSIAITKDDGTSVKDNYQISYNVSLSIYNPDEKIVYITGNKATFTYDGTSKSVDDYSKVGNWDGYDPNQVICAAITSKSATKAGTYSQGLTKEAFSYGDVTQNVQFVVVDGLLTITPLQITENMFEIDNDTFTYNTKEQGPIAIYKGTTPGITSDDYTVVGNRQTDVGTYTMTIVGRNNLAGCSQTFTWSIQKATMKINVDKSMEYNGNKFTYYLTDDDVEGYSLKDQELLENNAHLVTSDSKIGHYSDKDSANSVQIVFPADIYKNYNVETDIKLTITKRQLVIQPKDATFEYDGLAHKLLDSEIQYKEIGALLSDHTVSNIAWNTDGQTIKYVGVYDNIKVVSLQIHDSTGANVTDCYDLVFEAAKMTISKAKMKISITGNQATYAYDGKGHTVSGYSAVEDVATGATKITGLFDKNKVSTKSECCATGESVGTTAMGLKANDFIYSDDNVNAEFVIAKDGSLTITATSISAVNASATNMTYNGKEQSTTTKITFNGKNLVEGVDFDVDTSSQTKGTAAGTYTITIIGKGNFSGSKTFSWEILKASVDISVYGNSETYYYDGKDHIFPGAGKTAYNTKETSISGVYDSAKITYSSTSTITKKDLGTYYLELDYTKFAYNDANVNAHFKVENDASMTIKSSDITGSEFTVTAEDLTYNGTVQNVALKVKQNGNELAINRDYQIIADKSTTSATDVGTYYVSIQGIGNYQGTKTTIAWNIKPAAMTIKITGSSSTTVYNGQVQSASGYTATATTDVQKLFDPSCVTLTAGSTDKVEGINASDTAYSKQMISSDFVYTNKNVNATFDVTDAKITLKIDKKALIVKAIDVKKHDTKTLLHAVKNYEAIGQVGNEVVGGTVESNGSDAKEYPYSACTFNLTIDGVPIADTLTLGDYTGKAFADANDTQNYTIDKTQSTLTIVADATPYIKVIGATNSVEYDGSEHTLSDYRIESNITVDQTKLAITMTPATGTNVGTYSLAITEATYPGITPSWTSGSLEITKRSLASSDIEVKYDGDPLEYTGGIVTPDASKVSVVDKGSATPITANDYSVVFEDGTNLGTYKVRIVAKPDGNYKDENTTATYSITKAKRTIKITGKNSTVDYSGEEQSVEGYSAVETPATSSKILDLSKVEANQTCKAAGTNAASYQMGIDINKFKYTGDTSNVDVSFELVEDGKLTIKPVDLSTAAVSIEFTKQKYVYNAKTQGPQKDDITVKLTVGGTTRTLASFDYSISGNEGVNVNTYTLTVTGYGNYENSATADWYIIKASRTVKVTGHQDTVEYNGAEQQVVGYDISVSGYDTTKGEEPLVNKDKIILQKTGTGDQHDKAARTDVGTTMMNLSDSLFSYSDTDNMDVTFSDTVDGYITVEKCSLDKAHIIIEPVSFVYDAQSHKPTITITFAGKTLIEGTDYVLSGDTESKTNVDTYTINIEAGSSSMFSTPAGGLSKTWSITKAPATITIDGAQKTTVYNGTDQKLSDKTSPDKTYTATSASSLFSADKVKAKDGVELDVTGKNAGKYDLGLTAAKFVYDDNNVDATFVINSDGYLNITRCDIATLSGTINKPSYEYDGQLHTPSFEVKNGDVLLDVGTDFVLSGQSSATDYSSAPYVAVLEGIGNYYGQITNGEWLITKRNMKIKIVGDKVTVPYDGKEHTAKGYTAYAVDEKDKSVFDYKWLTPSIDSFEYTSKELCSHPFGMSETTMSYTDPSVNATLDVVDGGLFISKKTLTEDDVDIVWPDSPLTYNGTTQNYNPESVVWKDTKDPVETKWYSVVDASKKDTGSYTAKVVFDTDEYSGTFTQDWEIVPYKVTVYLANHTESTQEYSGKSAKLQVVLSKESTITEEKIFEDDVITLDFETSQPNVNVYNFNDPNGKAITCNRQNSVNLNENNYEVTYVGAMEITKRQFKEDDPAKPGSGLTITCENPTYNGLDQEPTNIKVHDNKLDVDVDASDYTYTIDKKKDVYESSTATSPAVYEFTVMGSGKNYSEDTIIVKWSIIPYDLEIKNAFTQTYNGKQVTKTFDLPTGLPASGTPENLEVTFDTKGQSSVGLYSGDKLNASAAGKASEDVRNYNITYTGSIEITKKNLNDTEGGTVVFDDVKTDYDATYQTPDLTGKINYTTTDGDVLPLANTDYELKDFVPQRDVLQTGTYTITVKGTGNYDGEISTTWTIKPATLSYDLTSDNSKPYDGTVFEKTITLTSVHGLKGSNTATVKYTSANADKGSYSIGDKNLNATLALGAGINAFNYVSNFSGSATITARAFDPDPTSGKFTVNYSDVTYNGQEQGPEISGLEIIDNELGKVLDTTDYTLSGDTKAIHVAKVGETTQATYVLMINGDGNYDNTTSLTKSWHINPAAVTADAGSDSVVYNGQKVTSVKTIDTKITQTGQAEKDKIDVTFETSAADADTYSVKNKKLTHTASATSGSLVKLTDYTLTYAGEVIITPKNISNDAGGAFVFNVDDRYYDGAEHRSTFEISYTPTGATSAINLVEGTDFKFDVEPKAKDVPESGTYTSKITAIGKNYTGSKDSNSWTINPVSLDYTLPNSTKEFSGLPYEQVINLSAKETTGQDAGLKGSDIVKLTFTTDGINAGTYEVGKNPSLLSNISFENTLSRNYSPQTIGGSATIIPKTITESDLDIDYENPLYYDGSEKKPSVSVKTKDGVAVSGDNIKVTVDSHIDVIEDGGTTPTQYEIKVEGQGNYTTTSPIIKYWHIEPRPLTVTPDPDQSKVFGDSDPDEFTYQLTNIVKGQTPDIRGKLNRVAGEDVGNYEITNTSTTDKLVLLDSVAGKFKTSNYQISLQEGVNFQIYALEAELEWGDLEWTYDSHEHSTTCKVKNIVTGYPCDVTLANNSITNAGSHDVEAVSLSNSNYKMPDDKTRTLKVNPVSFDEATKYQTEFIVPDLPYNGKEQTNDKYTVKYTTPSGEILTLVNGKDFELEYVLKQKDVPESGKYPAKINALGPNFTGSKEAEWTIIPAKLNYSFSDEVVYSGTVYTKNVDLDNKSGVGMQDDDTLNIAFKTESANADTYTLNTPGHNLLADLTFGNTEPRNYNLEDFAAQVVIKKKKLTKDNLSVEFDEPTYNGSPQIPDNIVVKLKTGETLSIGDDYDMVVDHHTDVVDGSGTVPTNYPIYIDGKGNYETDGTLTYEWNMNPRDLTVTPDSGQTKVFGQPDPNFAFTASGLVLGQEPQYQGKLTRTDSKNENVGTYQIVNTLNPGKLELVDNPSGNFKASNYHIDIVEGVDFTITQLVVDLKWGETEWTYDGKEHSTTCIVGNEVQGFPCKVTLENNSITNAGSVEVRAIKLSDSNYVLPDPASKTLIVNAASLKDADVKLDNLIKFDPDEPTKEQKQGVKDVKVGDYNLAPGDDYSVSGDTAIDPGKYKLKLEPGTSGNFKDDKEVYYVVIGPTQDDLHKIDPDLNVDTDKGGSSTGIDIESPVGDIAYDLSDANEMSDIAAGLKKMRIWISIKDISSTISQQSKALLDAEVAKVQGCSVGQYDDISMYKEVKDVATGDVETTTIHEINTPVSLKLTPPESLKPTSEKATLGLLRNHNSAVSDMKPEYDASAFTLRFKSDRFSDYALTITNPDQPQPKPDPQPTPQQDDNATGSSKTGEILPIALCVFFAVALGAAGILSGIRRRRKFNK